MALTTTGGDLREVIDLQKDVAEPDWTGHPGDPDWQTQFSTPARIRTLKGGETVMAGRLQATQTHVVTVRWQPAMEDVQPAWRAVNARTGQIHNIRSITPDERGAWVDILTETGE